MTGVSEEPRGLNPRRIRTNRPDGDGRGDRPDKIPSCENVERVCRESVAEPGGYLGGTTPEPIASSIRQRVLREVASLISDRTGGGPWKKSRLAEIIDLEGDGDKVPSLAKGCAIF